MKTWRTIQKIAVAVGMTYGMWLGTNVDATDADSRNAFVIIVLSVIVAISMYTPDKEQERTLYDGAAFAPVRCRSLAQVKQEKFLIMEMFGKTLCVTFEDLVGSGIMSKSNFDKHVREHKFRVLQKGGNGRKVFVAYESLSDALRSIVEENYLMPKNNSKTTTPPMDERLKSDSKAVEFFRTYTPAISYDKQVEYVLNAKVLNAMVAQEKSMTARHNANGFNHKSGYATRL